MDITKLLSNSISSLVLLNDAYIKNRKMAKWLSFVRN
jgi:hypothetical protein